MWSWTSSGVRVAVEAAQQPAARRSRRSAARSGRGRPPAACGSSRAVVVALDQPRAVLVADVLVLGRVELDVVDVAGFLTHTRRPERRRTTSSSGTSISSAAGELAAELRRAPRRAPRPAPRCAGSRRAGSRRGRRPSPTRSRIMPMITSSGTSSPASMYSLACLPSSVSSRDLRAQHVARGDVRQAEVVAQAVGLRALAGARAGRAGSG